MVPDLRKKFNSEFSEQKYKAFLKDINETSGVNVEFRIAETPIFISRDFKEVILKAVDEIVSYLTSEDYKKLSLKAIPTGFETPNDPDYTDMMALDFAICRDADGNFIPQLIELQGFSSLYFYELLQNRMYRKHFNINERYGGLFNIHTPEEYTELLRQVIVDDENPENVILLEVEPEKQKTRVDFECCRKAIGVKPVCISKVRKSGRNLYYEHDGKKIDIRRIYNRVIFDELLKRKDLELDFSFTDDLDVSWVPHPNWFFRISKFSLPYIKSKYVPETFFLSDINKYPDDIENFVLKPLFSFAGSGVIYDISEEDLNKITDRSNYILQRKIKYEPVIETPDEPAKAELRLLFIHKNKEPYLVNNLVRLSKGKMMGVDFNKDKTWVGSSIAYFEHL